MSQMEFWIVGLTQEVSGLQDKRSKQSILNSWSESRQLEQVDFN